MATISVVICTRDRADFLRETLASIAEVKVPEAEVAELVIVDNGSTDHTQDVVERCALGPFESIRCIEEKRPGLSHARNTAVVATEGEIVLFTDDDVRVPTNWISGMIEPIRAGRADAVAGGVELAPHLQRPWQEKYPGLTSPLACTRNISSDDPERMVGANMALAREVLEQVPPFDTNLGAGSQLGMGEETLLAYQIKDEGFRLVVAFDVSVEHHCHPDRLLRDSYLEYAEKIGRSQAYIDYHWYKKPVDTLRLCAGLVRRYARLVMMRMVRYEELQALEGIPEWEFQLLFRIYYRRQLLTQRRRNRACN